MKRSFTHSSRQVHIHLLLHQQLHGIHWSTSTRDVQARFSLKILHIQIYSFLHQQSEHFAEQGLVLISFAPIVGLHEVVKARVQVVRENVKIGTFEKNFNDAKIFDLGSVRVMIESVQEGSEAIEI